MFFVVFTVSCGTSEIADKQKINLPEWFVNPPKDPGKFFYSTSGYQFKGEPFGRPSGVASQRARQELAESLKAKCASLFKTYSEKIIKSKSRRIHFVAGFEPQFWRSLVNNDKYGAQVFKQEILRIDDKDLMFTLLKIGFDGVAKVLLNEAKREFREVRENPAEAFPILEKLLIENTVALESKDKAKYIQMFNARYECGANEINEEEKINLPEWFINPPKEPGKFFYSTSGYTFDKSTVDPTLYSSDSSDSIDSFGIAAARARQEIAASLKAKIESVLKDYSEKITYASGKTHYNGWGNPLRALVNNDIYGAQLTLQEILKIDDEYVIFTLLKIGFDGVAKVLLDEAKKEFQEVRENPDKAFLMLKELLIKDTTSLEFMDKTKFIQMFNESNEK